MDENMRSRLAESVRSFHIPRLGEIPDVGLYLEQVTRYVNQSITGCGLSPITASMVSNYVKQKIIPGPEKKAYGAESIAYLAENCPVPIFADPVSTAKAVKLQPVLGRLHTLKPNRLEAELLSGVKITDDVSLHRAADALLKTGLHRVFICLLYTSPSPRDS